MAIRFVQQERAFDSMYGEDGPLEILYHHFHHRILPQNRAHARHSVSHGLP